MGVWRGPGDLQLCQGHSSPVCARLSQGPRYVLKPHAKICTEFGYSALQFEMWFAAFTTHIHSCHASGHNERSISIFCFHGLLIDPFFPSLYLCIFKGWFIFLRSSLQGDSSTSNKPIMLPVTLGIPCNKAQGHMRQTHQEASTHPLSGVGIVVLWIKEVLVQLVLPAELCGVRGVL